MSRIGKMPIQIPQGVEVEVDGHMVTVKGPKGTLSKKLHNDMIITKEDNAIHVERPSDHKNHRSLHGLTRTLINNMVIGVSTGFSKKLLMTGVGYKAAMQGKKLVLNVGYSHPVEIDPGEDLSIEVPAPTEIIVKGIDKEKVGALAANIRSIREPEPYKGKGIRYENERIIRKVGKAGK